MRPQLLQPCELKGLLNGDVSPVVIVAVGKAPPQTVIPGAGFLCARDLELGPEIPRWQKSATPEMMEYGHGNLLPPQDLVALAVAAGIRENAHVVLYAAELTDLPLDTARALWGLNYIRPLLKIQSLGFLDGGLAGWVAEGLCTAPYCPKEAAAERSPDGGDPNPPNVTTRIVAANVDTECVATTEEVVAAVMAEAEADPPLMVDTRSAYEFEGLGLDEVEYTYVDKAGRLPNAYWGKWGPSTYVGGDWWETDPTTGVTRLLTRDKMATLWTECGFGEMAAAGREVIFYCGSGWRSALAWFIAMAVLGWPRARNYDGGWVEYAQTHPNANSFPQARGKTKLTSAVGSEPRIVVGPQGPSLEGTDKT